MLSRHNKAKLLKHKLKRKLNSSTPNQTGITKQEGDTVISSILILMEGLFQDTGRTMESFYGIDEAKIHKVLRPENGAILNRKYRLRVRKLKMR